MKQGFTFLLIAVVVARTTDAQAFVDFSTEAQCDPNTADSYRMCTDEDYQRAHLKQQQDVIPKNCCPADNCRAK